VLGVLLVAVFLTHGFGLLKATPATPKPAAFERQGDKIVIPESSPLRKRITVSAAQCMSVSGPTRLRSVTRRKRVTTRKC